MTALEVRDGWLMPAAVIPNQFAQWQKEAVEHIDAAIPFLKGRCMAIQAGGNLGIWPKLLIEKYDFRRVITFEPDEVNFKCLVYNTEFPVEIQRFQSAIGDKSGTARWARASEHKPGWHKIAPNGCAKKFVSGEVPIMTIDELCLPADHEDVDFIALDVEGYELPALIGAEKTIARCRPVILFEDLGRSTSESFRKKSGVGYGYEPGATQRWLTEHGYSRVAEVKNDEVWAC